MVADFPCPACGVLNKLVKAGRTHSGTQKYKCRACKSTRVYYPRRRSRYGEGWHAQVNELRLAGKSFREIGRILGIAPQSAANWFRRQTEQKTAT